MLLEQPIPPNKLPSDLPFTTTAEKDKSATIVYDIDDKENRLKWAFRKVDASTLFLLFLSQVMNALDRSNLGLSKVVGLERDTGMSGSDFNVVNSIMYPTNLLFMLPSNLMVRKVGARLWLPFLTMLWGIINMCMAFVKNKTDLILCRLFLGAAESGISPGALMLIALWYPRSMVTSRVSLFYSAVAAGGVIGGPIATGIGKITSTRFKPWGWIFFIEGLVTVGYSLIMFIFLADYPDKSWVLRADEKAAISQRMAQDQAEGGKEASQLQASARPYAGSTYILSIAGSVLFQLWPKHNHDLQRDHCQRDGLQRERITSDAGGTRDLRVRWDHSCAFLPKVVWIALSWHTVLRSLAHHRICYSSGVTGNVARIIALCILSFASFGSLGVAPGWLMSNAAGPTRASASSAIDAMLATLGGLCTSYIYRNKDAPRYIFGHGMNMFAACLMVVVSTISHFIIVHRNKLKETSPTDISGMSQTEIDLLENDHPDFRYVN
ncbi:MFS general substrate transporter [Linderina pennispora]|uniref:MFS general substrate transporter n=1 Tax=Linderina pennispora TaxID=61395 RepID=A0A1Y1WIT7_9FUNG|nr:MFS general substrate transporter [Linderina pennispora]ORX73392.1 MFS general substrate transporter [Linderina pennispora]